MVSPIRNSVFSTRRFLSIYLLSNGFCIGKPQVG
jgi:hypothetical protein